MTRHHAMRAEELPREQPQPDRTEVDRATPTLTLAIANDGQPALGPLLGEVIDTHHPHLPGRIAVRWHDGDGDTQQWLRCDRTLAPRRGDRVLISHPANFPGWIITSVVDRGSDAPETRRDPDGPTIALEPGQAVSVTSADGCRLLEVTQGTDGPVVRLLEPDVDIELDGRLRMRAQVIELEAEGGVDIRTQGDAIMRARTIRLN